MPSASSTAAVRIGAIATAFAATMVAMWSFAQARPAWGGYNLAIALVALAVVIAARARDYEDGSSL